MAKTKHAIIIFFSLILIVNTVSAEYFGRNKVQYEQFTFNVLQTTYFKIYYYPSETVIVKDAGRMLERWNERYTKIFGKPLTKGQPVILYANHADFQQTNTIGGLISQGTGGVTEGYLNRMIIPLTGNYEENDHVLGHELVHAFQYEIMKSNELGLAGGSSLPLWFVEGMAEYLSIGSFSPLTSMWMRDAVLFNDVPGILQLNNDSKYFPYRYGHALWAYIASKYGDNMVGQLYLLTVQGKWQNAFSELLGKGIDTVSNEWTQELKTTFGNQINGRELPSGIGKRILDREEMSLSPKISPDGKFMAVYSSKDLFAIDLFIVEIASGKVVQRLGSSESDLHFDAVRYVNSIGSWSPDSKKFAFVIFKNGNNSIGIFNVKSGKYKQTISLDKVEEIGDIAWSPDGTRMAVSGATGGEQDLYMYSFKDKSTKRLTKDKYADLMPSWSPDGKSLLFSTDRGGGTSFDSLTYGPLKIGKLTLETGEISVISMAPWVKHIDPQYSNDCKNIFFVADPDGFSDIYRYSTDSNTFYRITRIATGVSGLTENSSAMSIARDNGKIAFNVFEKSGYKVQLLDSSKTTGTRFLPFRIDYLCNTGLTLESGGGTVSDYLCKSSDGLDSSQTFLVDKYKPRLKLLYIGQLSAGISADPLGIGVVGGISFLFSDLLGDQVLGLGAQVAGSIQDFGGEVYYLNLHNRFNWGVTLNRVAYLATRTTIESGTDTINGTGGTVVNETFLDQHIYDNNLSGVVDYPLSVNRRIEVNAGVTHESYEYRAEKVTVSGNTVIDDYTTKIQAPSAINLFQAGLAYVGDFSYFGFNGPVSGRRFRLEIGYSVGSLQYMSLLADYRQYVFLNPFTLAFRFFHFGRYLRDSEDERLTTLFLGNETWVRGYEESSFDLAKCSEENDNRGCPEYDRLQGSRIGVVNMELRFPLIGVERYGLINFRYLPVDILAFLDGGVAWDGNDKPVPKIERNTQDRVPVFSAGAATRINILGLLILQVYYAYPFQRTDTGGHWGFVFAPAW
jgi:Tol biopolymer transport system component